MSDVASSPVLLTAGVLYALLALASPKAALFVLLPTFALAPETQVGQVLIRPDDVMLSILAISWGLRRVVSTARRTPALASMLNVALALGFLVTQGGAAKKGVALAVLLGSLYTLPFGLGRNYAMSTLLTLVSVAVWRKRPAVLLLPLAVVVVSLAGVT